MTAMDDLSRLALAAGAGDHVATRRLVEATQPQVWQLCAYLGSGDDTDDLVQETYLRALRALPRYRGDAPVSHWLLAIARRVCADEVRRRTRARRTLGRFRALTRDVDDAPVLHGHDIDLELLVRRLDPERRDAFVLTQLVGLRYDEAAVVCNCPVGTIRSRVARARAELVRLAREANAV
jgi:RNA polymerase sigma-70 factor (ECF subfamily)